MDRLDRKYRLNNLLSNCHGLLPLQNFMGNWSGCDGADQVKDTLNLPWFFICAKEKMAEQEFRQQIQKKLTEHKALDFMFQQVKQQALPNSSLPQGDDCMDAVGRKIPEAIVEARGEGEAL